MESQTSRGSPLGSFARLPIELCQTIWGYIFYLELHAPLKQEQLPILWASQALHNDITSINYDTVEIHNSCILEGDNDLPPEEVTLIATTDFIQKQQVCNNPF